MDPTEPNKVDPQCPEELIGYRVTVVPKHVCPEPYFDDLEGDDERFEPEHVV